MQKQNNFSDTAMQRHLQANVHSFTALNQIGVYSRWNRLLNLQSLKQIIESYK